jgi:hypothetical protein
MYLADLEDSLAVVGPRLAQICEQDETPMTTTPSWGEAVVAFVRAGPR